MRSSPAPTLLLYLALACSAGTRAPASRLASGREAGPFPGMQGLLDSLAPLGSCPSDLQVEISGTPLLTHQEACALVAAMMRRLATEVPNPGHWEPADTSLAHRAMIWVSVSRTVAPHGAGPIDSLTGMPLVSQDTVIQVALDVPHRPRLLRVLYDAHDHTEVFSPVHRETVP